MRKKDTQQTLKKPRRLLKALVGVTAALLVLVLVGGVLVGNYFYNLALNPNSDKSAVLSADHNQYDGFESAFDDIAYEYTAAGAAEWFDSVGYTTRTQQSYDGLALSAYEIKNPNAADKWVIVCHGYTSNATQMVASARVFYDMGYSALLPDARGQGNSEGSYIGMGWHDRLDIVSWAEQLAAQYPNCQIVLYGISMGGATVMMAAGEALPKNVKAIVEDCGYSSVYDEFAYQLGSIFGLPAFPFMQFASLVTWVRAGYRFPAASAIDQVAKSETPILFIHGDQDTFVPFYMLDEVYEAANCEKQKLVVEGAGHGMASIVDPELYWSTVTAFLDKYID